MKNPNNYHLQKYPGDRIPTIHQAEAGFRMISTLWAFGQSNVTWCELNYSHYGLWVEGQPDQCSPAVAMLWPGPERGKSKSSHKHEHELRPWQGQRWTPQTKRGGSRKALAYHELSSPLIHLGFHRCKGRFHGVGHQVLTEASKKMGVAASSWWLTYTF